MEDEEAKQTATTELPSLKRELQILQDSDEDIQSKVGEGYTNQIKPQTDELRRELEDFPIIVHDTFDDTQEKNLSEKIAPLRKSVRSIISLKDNPDNDIHSIRRDFDYAFYNFMLEFLPIKIQKTIDNCMEIEIDKLMVNPKWGTVNFKSSQHDFERLFSTLRVLRDLQLNHLSIENLKRLAKSTKPIENIIESIKNFDVAKGGGSDTRDQLASDLRVHVDSFYEDISRYIGFPIFGEYLHGKLLSDLHEQSAEMKEIVQTARTQLQDIISNAKDVAGRTGVMGYTGDFGKTASDHKKWAQRWLWATAVLGIGALLVAGGSFFNITIEWLSIDFGPKESGGTVDLIENAISKFIFLGFLISATLWCGRQYKAQKHQEAVNRHRANSLTTFKTFVDSAKADDSREVVLIETTRSIFAHRPTGYMGSGESRGDSETKIMEFVKSAGKTITRNEE